MEYIGFWKVVGGDVMDVIEKFRKMTAERGEGKRGFCKNDFWTFPVHWREQGLYDV